MAKTLTTTTTPTTTTVITEANVFEVSLIDADSNETLTTQVSDKVAEARGIADTADTEIAIKKMDPEDKMYPATVLIHREDRAPTFWYVGNEALLFQDKVALVMGERQHLEKAGDPGYRNARIVIDAIAPHQVIVVGNKMTPITGWNKKEQKAYHIRQAADVQLAEMALAKDGYVIIVLGTALLPQYIEQYKEHLEAGHLLILTFIDPDALDQKSSLKFSRERSAFVASLCSEVLVIEVSDQDSGSWNTAMLTREYGHRLYVLQGKNTPEVNEVLIEFYGATPIVSRSDLAKLALVG